MGAAPRNLIASVALFGGDAAPEPPRRVRIWRPGENPGDYGVIVFSARAAAAIMEDYRRRGTLLAIDIEHNQNPTANPCLDPNSPPVTGGYCALELVETSAGPELWMLPDWSDCGAPHAQPGVVCCAAHQIRSKQRRYISPDWWVDPETNEPLRLNRISLVSEPATYGINLLASRAATGARKTMNEEQLRAAYATAKMQAEGAEGELKAAAAAYMEQLKTAAAALGVDLEAEPAPASEQASQAENQPGAQPAAATASAPPNGMANRAATRPRQAAAPAPAQRPMTRAELDAYLAERDERGRLLELNKDRIPEGHRNMLGSRSIADVREYIAGLGPRPAPAGTQGDTGGALVDSHAPGQPRAWKKALSAVENFMASRFRAALGQTEAKEKAFEDKVEEDGGITVSIVDIVERKRAERLKAMGRASA